jgi:hypothetical protein
LPPLSLLELARALDAARENWPSAKRLFTLVIGLKR